MNPPRFRVNLRQLMIAVAALSVMFTMLGVVGGSIATLFLLMVIVPLKAPAGAKRIEAWAISSALFPLLTLTSVFATWLAARLALGHDPDPLEFQKSYPSPLIVGARITTDFLAFLLPISFVVCAFTTVAAAKRRTWSDLELTGKKNALMAAPCPILWCAVFAFLYWDPFRIAATVLR
jgi:hypothetical protein